MFYKTVMTVDAKGNKVWLSIFHMEISQNTCKKGLFCVHTGEVSTPLPLYAWRTLLLGPLPPLYVRTK